MPLVESTICGRVGIAIWLAGPGIFGPLEELFSAESRSEKGGFCREAEAVQGRTDCGGVEAIRSGSSVGRAAPPSRCLRTDLLSLDGAIEMASHAAASSGYMLFLLGTCLTKFSASL